MTQCFLFKCYSNVTDSLFSSRCRDETASPPPFVFLKRFFKITPLFTANLNIFSCQVLKRPLLFLGKSSNSKAGRSNICCMPPNYTDDGTQNIFPPKFPLLLADLVSVQLAYEMDHYIDLCSGALQSTVKCFCLYDSYFLKNHEFPANLSYMDFLFLQITDESNLP